ncbi:MAG TPA: hypothetical protein RMH99_11480 [Sandaracinaceae bacterium LLY-WYZ-13_1]|nr:hypothetical protein [Sandaracinaceae bacterium LLY-WYZ-13_1]
MPPTLLDVPPDPTGLALGAAELVILSSCCGSVVLLAGAALGVVLWRKRRREP